MGGGGGVHDEILLWEILLKVIIDWCVVAVGYTWCIENRSMLTVKRRTLMTMKWSLLMIIE